MFAVLTADAVASATPIELRPAPGQEHAAREIEAVPAARVQALGDFFGNDDDRPILVTLAGERSGLAQDVAPWVAGYAVSGAGVVVIFPDRASSYPHSDLTETYLHELAHVFIARKAGGEDVPRWFHEAIAMAVSTDWSLQDRGRTTIGMIRRWDATHEDLERWFRGDAGESRRAYAIAEAFGRDYVRRYGPLGVQRVLARVADGIPFDRAFQEFTGRTVDGAWFTFWEDQTLVHRTIPLVSSGTVLWLVITGLALLAFRRRRARDARMEEMWSLEERIETLQPEGLDDETVN